MGLASMAIIGVGGLLITLTLNLIGGWNLDAYCPGSESFCDSSHWQLIVQYLPTWLFIAQLLVVLALAAPFALVRVGR